MAHEWNGSCVQSTVQTLRIMPTDNRQRRRERDLARSAESLYAHVWAIIWCGCISARGPCVCMLYAWHMFKYLYYHSCSLGATMWMAVSGLCCEQEVTAGSTPRSMYCGLTASHCGAAVVIRREWTRMVAWSAQFKYYSNWSVNQFRLHLMSSDSRLVRSFVALSVCLFFSLSTGNW